MPRQNYALLNHFAKSRQLEIEPGAEKRASYLLRHIPQMNVSDNFGYNDRWLIK